MRMLARIRPLALAGLMLAVPLALHARTQLVERHVDGNGTRHTRLLPPDHGVIQTIDRGHVVRSVAASRTAPQRFIVGFRSPPVLLAARQGKSALAARTDADRLRGDLAAIVADLRSKRPGAAPQAEVTRTYSQVYSGAAVSLTLDVLARVRALPYVSGVFPDDTVKATLSESVPLIGADSVHTLLGADGQGVRVGILDTGIDYGHAAFGGNGIGPGHKIAWGYDYTADDPDPMDGHGHGTHVAGIVAGNGGGVFGVAPGATLYVFRVLDDSGSGWVSWILTALEQVPDPDGNPATDDGMNVINMSLGAPGGRSDDPMATAVDHLVELGVVCAVAAGNSAAYYTIGTPGTSRRALTVGATDKFDQMTWFSSRGPVSDNFDLKPDVCAPGENIVSALRGGGTVAMSGTSMATPHVAGVAALLSELHPAWSADDIKGAIVGTARHVDTLPFEEGSGRVRAMGAATATFATAPSHLSFGTIDTDVATYVATDTLQVKNLTDVTRTVVFPDTAMLAPGGVLYLSPTHVVLGPHATQPVIATLVVDNELTPYPSAVPYGYSAVVLAESAGETHRIPATFHKTMGLTINSPAWIYQLNVIDRATGWVVYADSPQGPILLPPGDYDLMASYFPDWIFVTHENVHLDGNMVHTIDPAEATIVKTWANVDTAGQVADCNDGKFSYGFDSGTGMNFVGFPFTSIASNPTNPGCGVQWERAATDWKDFRMVFNGTVPRFDASGTVTNLPSELRHMPLDFPALPADSVATMYFALIADPWGGWFGFGFMFDGKGHHGAWTLDEWVMLPPSADHYSLGQWIELYGYDATRPPDLFIDWPLFYSPYVRYDHGWPLETSAIVAPFQVFGAFGGGRMAFGTGLPVWRGKFQNGPQDVTLDQLPETDLLHVEYDAFGALLPLSDPPFAVEQAGSPVASGVITGMGDLQTLGVFTVPLPAAGPTTFTTSRAYTLRNRAAAMQVNAYLNVGAPDPDPPLLASMQVLANGAVADSIDFATATAPHLRFAARDAIALGAAQARVRRAGTGSWTSLAPAPEGDHFVAPLPATLAGEIDLQIVLGDASNNTLTLTWSPAFVAKPASTAVEPGGAPPAAALSLAGAVRNPTRGRELAVSFSLPDASPATLALYDVTGREVASRAVGALGAGLHVLALGGERPLASGIYFVRLMHPDGSFARRVCVIR